MAFEGTNAGPSTLIKTSFWFSPSKLQPLQPVQPSTTSTEILDVSAHVPMEEDDEYEDEEDDEYYDGSDEGSEEYEEYEDEEGEGEEEEGDEESYDSSDEVCVCQCPACRRDREMQRQDIHRRRMEKEEAVEAEKRRRRELLIPKGPGTRSVLFQPVPHEFDARDDGTGLKDGMLQTITCMEGYLKRSTEELRFEDYCIDDQSLMAVKQRLDAEVWKRAALCHSSDQAIISHMNK